MNKIHIVKKGKLICNMKVPKEASARETCRYIKRCTRIKFALGMSW